MNDLIFRENIQASGEDLKTDSEVVASVIDRYGEVLAVVDISAVAFVSFCGFKALFTLL